MAAESSAPLWISLASLAISGVALGWNIYRDLVDRGKLSLTCYLGNFVRPGSVDWDKRTYLCWKVTNVGRQPVVLSAVGGDREQDPHHWFLMPPYLGEHIPAMLQPGETHVSASRDLSVLKPGLTSLWARDTLGRTYRAPKSEVEQVLADGMKVPKDQPA